MKYAISTKDAPSPQGPWSQGTSAARYIFISAQLPLDPSSDEIIDGSIEDKMLKSLTNCEEILKEIHMSRYDIAKLTVFVDNIDYQTEINSALSKFFHSPYPALSLVEVRRLPYDSPLSCECIACR